MKEEDYRAHFYATIIVPLKSEYYQNDDWTQPNYFSGTRVMSRQLPSAYIRFQKRPGDFQHQYQRERFLENRDLYVAMAPTAGSLVHVLTEKRSTNEIFIYTKSIEHLFPKDSELVLEVLKEMLSKLYTVRTRVRSTVTYFDSSNGRYGDNGRFRQVP